MTLKTDALRTWVPENQTHIIFYNKCKEKLYYIYCQYKTKRQSQSNLSIEQLFDIKTNAILIEFIFKFNTGPFQIKKSQSFFRLILELFFIVKRFIILFLNVRYLKVFYQIRFLARVFENLLGIIYIPCTKKLLASLSQLRKLVWRKQILISLFMKGRVKS